MVDESYGNKVRLIIGNLLRTADPVAKSVISAFDSTKDVSANRAILGGSRFTATALESCAKFLKIEVCDTRGAKLFTNKPSIANRIILEIQSLFPAICGECSEEYSTEHGSSKIPLLRCFLCFQGCYDCEQVTALVPNASLPLLSGAVWLCKSCHGVNNPVKPTKDRSRSQSSKSTSQTSSAAATPKTTQHPVISAAELTKKLQALGQQSRSPAITQVQQTPINEQELTDPPITNNEQPPISSTPPPLPVHSPLAPICEQFKEGKCPHGNQTCSKSHPKACRKFARNGTHIKWGCQKGKNCNRYHPAHCSTSLANKTCFDPNCTRPHIVGTKRKQQERSSSNVNMARSNLSESNQPRPSYRRPINQGATQRTQRNHMTSTGQTDQQLRDVNRFLELRDLLMTFKTQFQEEVK